MSDGVAEDHAALPAGDLFVGRDQVLAELELGLEDSVAGHGRLLLLAGEAGIGKTRTAEELVKRARQRGARALTGRCYEGEGAPACWPWVQILRACIEGWEPAALEAAMGPGAADIAPLLPELVEFFPHLPAPQKPESEQARFRLFDSITQFLRNASRTQPLVLMLDDLHWADRQTLLLLQFLVRELRESCVFVMGAYRDVELPADPRRTQLLGELARESHCREILLRGLEEVEVGRVIESIAGRRPAVSAVREIHRWTEGNPFFVGEIVRLLGANGGLASSVRGILPGLGLTEGIRQVLQRRFRSLSTECNRVLRVASVIGREFGLQILDQVVDLSGRHLLRVLDEAVVAHVLTEMGGARGRYSFCHALIREALYEDLSGAERVQFHRRVGEVLEKFYAANLEPHLTELSHHFFLATPETAVEKALGYALRAAERATLMLAYEEAAAQYERALEALELVEPADPRRSCEILLELGEAQREGGDVLKASETFKRAAALARELDAPEQLARAALGVGAPSLVGGAWTTLGFSDPYEADLLQEALGALEERDSILRAKLLTHLARALGHSESRERKIALSDQAITMARRIDDPETLAYALHGRYLALFGPEDPEDRLATTDEIVRIAAAEEDGDLELAGRLWRIPILLELGEVDAAHAELEAEERLAQDLRQPGYHWMTTVIRSTCALLQGRFGESERLARQALPLVQRLPEASAARMVFPIQMAALGWHQGRLEEYEEELVNLVEPFRFLPIASCWLAQGYAELGRENEARRRFEQVASNEFADLPRDASWPIALTHVAVACAVLDDKPRALVLYEMLRPYTGRNIVSVGGVICMGPVSRYLGCLAATLCRWDDAAQHFEDALSLAERMRAETWIAVTRFDYAAMLRLRDRPGDRERALELLTQALETARRLGMKGLGQKLAALEQELRGTDSGELDAATKSRTEAGAPVQTHVFRRESDSWTIIYNGATMNLRDRLGFHYVAILLRNPGREFHALDLVATARGHEVAASHFRSGDAEPYLDARAKRSYKQRLQELRDELTEAKSFQDLGRIQRVQSEIDSLVGRLTQAVGLAGPARKVASRAEQARKNVSRCIKAALRKIEANNTALGHHLATTIKAGLFSSYTPDPAARIRWTS